MVIGIRLLIFLLLVFSISGCAIFSNQKPHPPEQVDFGIVEDRLALLREEVREDLRVTVGAFDDKTGQYKDATVLRYSSAVTKGGTEVLTNVLYRALGPRSLVERNPHNLALMEREYTMAYKYDGDGRRIGLVQRGGPKGGFSGAEYLVTGAVIYYHVDRYSGGAGFNIQGWGASARFATAKVAVELRLVDMGSSEVVWSTIQQSGVEGWQISAEVFRFISSSGVNYLVQAEAGIAAQLPADYALHIALEESVVNMIMENEAIFLKRKAQEHIPPQD